MILNPAWMTWRSSRMTWRSSRMTSRSAGMTLRSAGMTLKPAGIAGRPARMILKKAPPLQRFAWMKGKPARMTSGLAWMARLPARTASLRMGLSDPSTSQPIMIFSLKHKNAQRAHPAPQGELLEDQDLARRVRRRLVGRVVRAGGLCYLHVHPEGGRPGQPAALWRRGAELLVAGRSLPRVRIPRLLPVPSRADRRQRRGHLHTARSSHSVRRRLLPVLKRSRHREAHPLARQGHGRRRGCRAARWDSARSRTAAGPRTSPGSAAEEQALTKTTATSGESGLRPSPGAGAP